MLRWFAALCLLLACSAVGGLSGATIQLPKSDAVPGWEREERLRRFTAADLYGHINGGAELFLELGFEELLVQTYLQGEREISLEVYRMESPLAALAIYLFKCGEETPWEEIEARNSSNRFQVVLVRGDCFVLLNSFSGEQALRPAVADLAGKLLETIPDADLGDPFAALPAEGRVAGSQRLVRGEYSLQTLYTFGPGDVLKLGGKLFGVAADYRAGDGENLVTKIRVEYPLVKEAAAVYAHLAEVLDPTLELLQQDGNRLVFRDYAGRFGLAQLAGRRIKISVNISERP